MFLIDLLCFFSFNKCMADHQNSLENERPLTRPTRGAIRLRQLLMRRTSGEKRHVVSDVITSVASGPYEDVLRSYLGVLTHT